ncbi:MAG: DUF4173 domain-containing protein [Anaerolineae bacterium]|jgi:hypothetical protein|nr:DUF4173 domain-containing protein [Anaerolineae bacterium]
MSENNITETTTEPAEASPAVKPSWQEKQGLPKHLGLFFLGGFILSFAVDFLFWQKPFGYSYAIWVGLILVVSLLLALKEKQEVHHESIFLIAALIATTLAAVGRMETGTRVYNVLASLVLIGLTCDTLISGGALRLRVLDTIVRFVLMVFAVFERPLQAIIAFGDRKKRKEHSHTWKTVVAPILRGVVIALPLLLIFSALFASADPVFEQAMANFFEWLKIEDWGEFLWRGFYILVLGILFAGALLHALSGKRNYTPDTQKPFINPFLGKIETFTIMGLIEVLFAVFVFIQFRYFFGGDTNINPAGYTFAEYARKGVNELIAVAILSLILYQILHIITKTPEKRDKLIMHVLMTVLFGLVLIMLFSSYQRVDLYQQAYGFSQIRMRTYIFIGWLAALISLVVVMEWLNEHRRFFAVLTFISLGFILSQAAVNIDKTIVVRNLERLEDTSLPAWAAEGLDHQYLSQLSDDAVPAMLKAADDEEEDYKYNQLIPEMLYAELYCRREYLSEVYAEELPWFSRSPSQDRAWNLLKDRDDLLHEDSTLQYDSRYSGDVILLSNGDEHFCNQYWERWD